MKSPAEFFILNEMKETEKNGLIFLSFRIIFSLFE